LSINILVKVIVIVFKYISDRNIICVYLIFVDYFRFRICTAYEYEIEEIRTAYFSLNSNIKFCSVILKRKNKISHAFVLFLYTLKTMIMSIYI
jgi:hypothetical protein